MNLISHADMRDTSEALHVHISIRSISTPVDCVACRSNGSWSSTRRSSCGSTGSRGHHEASTHAERDTIARLCTGP